MLYCSSCSNILPSLLCHLLTDLKVLPLKYGRNRGEQENQKLNTNRNFLQPFFPGEVIYWLIIPDLSIFAIPQKTCLETRDPLGMRPKEHAPSINTAMGIVVYYLLLRQHNAQGVRY